MLRDHYDKSWYALLQPCLSLAWVQYLAYELFLSTRADRLPQSNSTKLKLPCCEMYDTVGTHGTVHNSRTSYIVTGNGIFF